MAKKKKNKTKNNNQKRYCIWCGESIMPNMKECSKTGKELFPKEKPFRDYVVHKCKGDVEDKLFDLIKKFVKSHFYAITVTITIIISTVMVVAGRHNYIKNVNEIPTRETISSLLDNIEANESTNESAQDSEEKKMIYALRRYLGAADNLLLEASEMPVDEVQKLIEKELLPPEDLDNITASDDYESINNYIADNVINDVKYTPEHDYLKIGAQKGKDAVDEYESELDIEGAFENPDFINVYTTTTENNRNYFKNDNAQTKVGKVLVEAGYHVIEFDTDAKTYVESRNGNGPILHTDLNSFAMTVVMVEVNDNWYVASDYEL